MTERRNDRRARLTLAAYERRALRTALPQSVAEDLTLAVLGLSGATGELARLVKRFAVLREEIDRARVVDELGALLWYATLGAQAVGVPLEDVAKTNLKKLREG